MLLPNARISKKPIIHVILVVELNLIVRVLALDQHIATDGIIEPDMGFIDYMVANSLNLKSDSSLKYSIHRFRNPPSNREAGFAPPFVPNKVSESQITHKCRLALVMATALAQI